jgi:hypothetical protein
MEQPASDEDFAESVGGGDSGVTIDPEAAQAPSTRRIIYTGSIQLRVDDPRAEANTLPALAQRYGGYVSYARVYEYRTDEYRAEIQLRVQADQFDAAMSELRGMGTEILNESINTQDVTERYVDLEARIENLERTEEELQILLTEARENQGTTEDILSVYRELTSIRGEIESLQGQLNVLADQVSLATINVELVPPEAQVEIVDEQWSISRTVREALRTLVAALQGLADVTVTFLIAVAPILLMLALVLYILYRIARWLFNQLRGVGRSATTTTPAAPIVTQQGDTTNRPE